MNVMKKSLNKKPWIIVTNGGTLGIDTSHPEWQKWFINEIKRLSKYKIIK